VAKKYNLCFKQLKYDFDIKKILILEIVVEREKIQMEYDKVKTIKE